MSDRAPQPQDKYIVRMPDGLRARIKAAAEANNRSMNSEIVATLEREYPAPADEITMDDLHDWVMDIAALKDGPERLKLLRERNKRLASEPKWQGWKIGLVPVRDESGDVTNSVAVYRHHIEIAEPSPPLEQHQFKPIS